LSFPEFQTSQEDNASLSESKMHSSVGTDYIQQNIKSATLLVTNQSTFLELDGKAIEVCHIIHTLFFETNMFTFC
jgi:hypothetical protein